MHSIPAIPKLLMIALAAGFVLAGCTTQSAPDIRPGYSGSVSPALREHQRKQRIRYEEGNYRRLYRQKGCRRAESGCDGYARFRP